MMRVLLYVFLVASALSISTQAVTVYKYKNPKGKWVFSDKPPTSTDDFEEKEYKSKVKKVLQPIVFMREEGGQHFLMVKNPLYAPVEIEVQSAFCPKRLYRKVVSSNSTEMLCQSDLKSVKTGAKYRWVIGDSNATEDGTPYAIPLQKGLERRISQSFNGRYSHNKVPSLYAVDIAMPIGTNIAAARSGTVIHVKDDYHMGGNTQFFLDKANFVRVLHSDGTFADYAHILMGTAKVNLGDKVKVGDVIARSGSSGYSTGPHLHFVIRKNIGLSYRSVPFSFINADGQVFKPMTGMSLKGE